MRALTIIIALVALGVFASRGQPPQRQSDTDIRQKILGQWIMDLGDLKGTETYFADGKYVCIATNYNIYNHTNWVQSLAGTWGVTNGILTAQLPKSHRWKDYEVIRVDDNELIMKWNTNRGAARFTYTTIQHRRK